MSQFLLTYESKNKEDKLIKRFGRKKFRTVSQNGMVVTSQPLASLVAADILKQGGNAIDAAIAANSIMGIIEPFRCGIGGDLFCYVWDPRLNKLLALNASGNTPTRLNIEYLKKQKLKKFPPYHPLSITVPGCVGGWSELHQKYGKLKFSKVFEPAIHYASKGILISDLIKYNWENVQDDFLHIRKYNPDYVIPSAVGQLIRNEKLANLLNKISSDGLDAFYTGEIARQIEKVVKEKGGFLCHDDLKNYKSHWIEPDCIDYRGFKVYGNILPLRILNILENYDIKNMTFEQYIHSFIEAKKIAYKGILNIKNPYELLIADTVAANYSAQINPSKSGKINKITDVDMESGNSVSISVVDKDGLIISLIQDNHQTFGSGISIDELGFFLQNRGCLFSLNKEHYNYYQSDQNPFPATLPLFILKNNEPYLCFGFTGTPNQSQIQAQMVVNTIDLNMNVQETGDALRFFHLSDRRKNSKNGAVYLEDGISFQIIQKLMDKKHTIFYDDCDFGHYSAISFDWENHIYYGAAESRVNINPAIPILI